MKKTLLFLLSLSTAVSAFAVPVQAMEAPENNAPIEYALEPFEATSQASESTSTPPKLIPYWDRTSQIICNLGFSSGEANLSSVCFSWNSTDKVYISVTLQKQVGSRYTDVDTWYGNGTHMASVDEKCSVSRGTYYRLKVVATIYNSSGQHMETISPVYSTARYYG